MTGINTFESHVYSTVGETAEKEKIALSSMQIKFVRYIKKQESAGNKSAD